MDYSKPTDEFVRSIDIHELLPQQEPFVFVDRIAHFDMQTIVTEMLISHSKTFTTDGTFSLLGMIENIAQACAARIGYINKYVLKKEIRPGVIASIKKADVLEMPPIGTTLQTIVTVKEEVFDMLLLTAEVRRKPEEGDATGPTLYAVAELKMKG